MSVDASMPITSTSARTAAAATTVAMATMVAVSTLLAAAPARAQGATPKAPAASTPAAPAPQASASKKALAARLVALQQPALEQLSLNLVEQPVRQLVGAVDQALKARVSADRQEAVARQIQEEIRKYLDEALPLVRDRASKLGASQLGPAFEEKFTEDELRQIITFQESAANRKLQQVLPEISNGLAQKLVAETRGTVEPRFKALDASLAKLLGIAPAAGAGSAPTPSTAPATPAKPVTAPKAGRPPLRDNPATPGTALAKSTRRFASCFAFKGPPTVL